ncbi:porin [uncultured Tolumonas sp.]|uniref:porin n=1 Tax=uncultured Tolumonas sp. TaxID=263765 RepID=UPI00292F08B7|nr:porin [uncultured Tolumonas sp.]
MKKTLLAVVTTSLFAASANAAVVYDKDGQQVDVYGRIQYQAGQIYNDTNGKANNFGSDTTARLGVNGKWATGSDVALISKVEWQVASEAADGNKFADRYAFAGADFGNGIQATVGTQDSAFVELSDVTDVYNEYSGLIENQFAQSRWDDSAKVTYAADGWDLRSSVSFSDQAKDKTQHTNGTRVQNLYSAAAGYTVKLDDVSSLKPVVAYQALTGEIAGESYTNKQYAAGLGYTYDAFYVASTYGQSVKDKVSTGTAEDTKDTVWAVTGTYKVLPVVTLVAGFGQVDPHNAAQTGEDGTVTKYYVLGAQYDITPKAKAYTEYKINETANQDDNYYVGLQYNF